ncbi:MAG: EamA/RhaT family transporter [Fervidicoccus sp.]|nr:MAG: EamA/RhaT family transporter [Fervidicoccus sp.]
MMNISRRAELLSLFFIAWISISSASVLVILSDVNAFAAAFWRLFISFAILTASAYIHNKKISIRFSLITVVSGILLGMHFLLWMESLFLISVALSTTIVVTYPAIILLMEVAFLRERVMTKQIVGMLMAFIGVLLTVRPTFISGMRGIEGIALAGIASFFAGGYFFLGRIARKRGTELSQYVLPTYLTAAFIVFIAGLLWRVPILPFNLNSWIFLVALAIIPMIGGHTVMNYLLSVEKASFVTSIALGEPFGATLLSYIILDQKVEEETIFGMVLTIAGLLLLLTERAFGKTSGSD